ncbi:hypothetical protein PR048_001128 [Dryococelus australis]|uniref:Uncharacterized protein n=1 Tax=Dryococelus australis TaxID=614101 RepID=A0ABQ9IGI5_9NEOP|nr:hypothetical protein PR048_001128 [Dryococelus australis]
MPVVWKSWIQQFKWYVITTNVGNKPRVVQVAIFMNAIGPNAANIFNTFSFSEAESKNLSVIETKFDAYFAPKTNMTYERYLFNKITQAEGQPFDDLLTSLVNQGKKYKFGEHDMVCEKLLAEEDLTFDKTVKICRASEMTKLQVSAMRVTPYLECMRCTLATKNFCLNHKTQNSKREARVPSAATTIVSCICWSRQVLTFNSGQPSRTPDPSSSEAFFVSSINIHYKELDWIEKLTLPNGNSVSFKLDTGAQE